MIFVLTGNDTGDDTQPMREHIQGTGTFGGGVKKHPQMKGRASSVDTVIILVTQI